jgi:hypothetical protein
MTKRNIMRAFKIAEISGVDVPAQEGARVAIMKRAPGVKADPVQKAAALTMSVDGHSHMLHVSYDGMEYNSGQTSWENDHSHPWVRMEDGSIVVGEVKGHTHNIAVVGKAADKNGVTRAFKALEDAIKLHMRYMDGSEKPTEKSQQKMMDLMEISLESFKGYFKDKAGFPGADDGAKEPEMTKTVEDLQKQLDRANAVAELSDAQKTHFKALDAAGQDAFLAKSAAERDAELAAVAKAATDADPVVYKTVDGVELRKSAGEAVIALAKSNDALRKQNDALVAKNADVELTAEVERDYAHLPGDVEARKALVKAAKGIPDEAQRTVALNALKAQSVALKSATDTVGHGGEGAAAQGAEKELDELAKAYSKTNSVSFAKAYDAVLSTAEGSALYARVGRQ